MSQYQSWMFDDKQWMNVPKPYESWNILSYYVIVVSNASQVTERQSDFFDYTFAIMLQRETGWN